MTTTALLLSTLPTEDKVMARCLPFCCPPLLSHLPPLVFVSKQGMIEPRSGWYLLYLSAGMQHQHVVGEPDHSLRKQEGLRIVLEKTS
jgi:hypothetical protein